jgi:ABC-type bacteriocin/lantibiotic exporter with double-glycine peptidase domain
MKCCIFIVAILFVGPSLRADEGEPHPNDCGPNSLILLLRLAGRDVAFDAVKQALPHRHNAGYSLGELQSAASKFGIRLSGIRLDRLDLPLIYPAIAFLSNAGEGHFVLLRPVGTTGKVVQVLDPPSAPAVMDYEQLLASPSWTGRMLVRETPTEWFISWIWLGIPCALLLAGAILASRGMFFWWRATREPALQ